MAESGKKSFLAIILSGIALLVVVVGFVIYGMPAGGNTENLTVGMPKPTVPKKH